MMAREQQATGWARTVGVPMEASLIRFVSVCEGGRDVESQRSKVVNVKAAGHCRRLVGNRTLRRVEEEEKAKGGWKEGVV